ncbi:vWA domain-containing protein [Paraliomyxa miuraensis]|uniref:vWA domain-containing protein n=1 Tax=Paraliomyxa miuraensis TaxID=376150 RepID=UPI00225B6951|nr:hypothetical protein [Paraliomyxa miuraensis]MCX4245204.1 hypothetical protein [Paraliomyxa miuraensis]
MNRSTTWAGFGSLWLSSALVIPACTAGDGNLGFDSHGTATTGVTTGPTGSSADDSSEDTGPRLDLAIVDVEPDSCADVMAQITPGEATIALLIDQSGTMSASLGGSGVDRWQAVYDTLLDPDTGVVAGYESEMKFGMTLYTNGDPPPGCPDLTVTPPAYDNRDAMAASFAMAMPVGDTPTGESLLAVGQALAALDDGSAKAVILATDGEPDTCACPNACAGASKGVAIEATGQLWDMGIRVFVIAVGDSITDLAHLQYLANVGAGKAVYFDDPGIDEWNDPWVMPTDPPDPAPLFTANDPTALEQAFGSLIAGFVPCDFVIEGTIEDVAKACQSGKVLLDGVELECPVDWEVVDESTLQLLGASCEALQDGMEHEVTATFPCGVIMQG